ncbi:MAG TPA: hypothetical protein VF749_01995, partial [Candidatus Acidoferrum sp.]
EYGERVVRKADFKKMRSGGSTGLESSSARHNSPFRRPDRISHRECETPSSASRVLEDFAQLLISINERFEDFSVNESLYFPHLSWGQPGDDRTFHVAISFPLRLILKESRLNLLAFGDLCCGAGIACREPRIGVAGQREVPMNNANLAGSRAGDEC